MVIKTDFKDYYDYIAHIYGGGDPRIIYLRPHRKKMGDDKIGFLYKRRISSKISDEYLPLTIAKYFLTYEKNSTNEANKVSIIVVGDIYFTFIKNKEDKERRLINEKDIKRVLERERWFFNTEIKNLRVYDVNNVKYPKFVELCRKIDTPVFNINIHRDFASIDEYCPILGKSEIPAYISAQDMYQNLSYFIGNTMKLSPDTVPPVVVADKYKIVGHGFDLKTSFRGTKKEK
jgi:hypothetical protein